MPTLREQPRKNLRLRGFDYSKAGAYFITLVAFQRECLFGDIVHGRFAPNEAGEIVVEEWLRTPKIRPAIRLDAFVVMPNHLHAVVIVSADAPVGAHNCAPLRSVQPTRLFRQPRSLGSLVAGFKSAVTKQTNVMRDTPGIPVWQRNYYDHIVRDDEELARIREYIVQTPLEWDGDAENPSVRSAPIRTA